MEPKRTILVTAASSAIGRALVAELVKQPCRVLAHYHSANPSVFNNLGGPGEIKALKANLADADSVARFIESIKEECVCPDSFIHLPARKLTYQRFPETQWTEIHEDLDLQARSAFAICQAFLPLMAKNRIKARIVFMLSSVTLGMPPKHLLSYSLVKHSLLGLMRSLASEYASSSVRINAISPSMVETDFLSEVPSKLVEIAAASHPMRRNAMPADLIPALLFLLSEDSDYITGVNLPVTGGQVL